MNDFLGILTDTVRIATFQATQPGRQSPERRRQPQHSRKADPPPRAPGA